MSTPKSAPKKFDFDPPMQDDILKICIQDNLFAEAATHWVKPGYFSSDEQAWMSSFLNDFNVNHGMTPTVSEAKQGLRDAVARGAVKPSKA